MDWEAKYNELKRERDEVIVPLLQKALKYVPADEESDSGEGDPLYKLSIAPEDLDLPVIMTMCTPAERQVLIRKVQAKIIDNEWRGAYNVLNAHQVYKKVAKIPLKTAKSTADFLAGKRKVAPVEFKVVHVQLLSKGEYPTETRNVCNHICHKGDCIIADHLVWSSSDDNNRRERKCRKQRVCNCGLQPRCDFTLHKEE